MKPTFTFLFLFIACHLFAQPVLPDWSYALRGFQTVDPSGVETDSTGNVYVSGTYSGWLEVPGLKERFKAPNHCGAYLIRINKRGETQWALPFLSSNDSRINAMCLLPKSGVAVAGFCDSGFVLPSTDGKTNTFKGGNACFMAVYDSLGRLQWSRIQRNAWGEATSLAADASGNIYYTGYFRRGFEGEEIVLPDSAKSSSEFLMKFSPQGALLWQQYFRSTIEEHYFDKHPRVFTSTDGRICFASRLTKGRVLHCTGNRKEEIASVNRHSGYVLCLNESGDKIWTRQYGGMWAHQVLDGCFTTQGDFLFVVDFGSEFYIGDGNQPLPAGIPEKPEGATSGFAWARLDPGGDLLDLDFHTGQTGAHGTRSRFIEQLPDGAFVMGGEFTNVLDFKERDSKGLSVSGQPLNHNAWQGVFMGDGTLESLWKPLSAETGFSFPYSVSCRGQHFATALMCYEDQEAHLKTSKKKISKAERTRFTVVTAGSIIDRKPVDPNVLPLACSDEVLVREISKVERTDAEFVRSFLRDSLPGALNTENNSNEITAANSLSASRGTKVWATLYPNPAKENTRLRVDSGEPFLSLSLFTASGCLLRKDIRRADSGEFEVEIALGNLPAGMYVLICESGNLREVFRIVHVY
jgi:hypothetical protein